MWMAASGNLTHSASVVTSTNEESLAIFDAAGAGAPALTAAAADGGRTGSNLTARARALRALARSTA